MNASLDRMVVVLAVLLAVGVAPVAANVEVGDRPELRLRTLDGRPVTNQSLAGRLVILEFWATWCGPCIAQLPHLKKLHEEYRDKGVALVSVSIDKHDGVVRRFVEENQMVWPQVHAPGLSRDFGVSGIPHAFILSPDGQVLWRDHPARLDSVLDELLEKHPPRVGGATADENAAAADAALVEEALESLLAAREAAAAGDYASMAQRVASLPAEALADRRVVGRARVLIATLKTRPDAGAEIEALRAADPAFASAWDKVVKAAAPRAAEPGAVLAAGQSGAAPQLLAAKWKLVEGAHERGDYYRAWKACEWLVERGGDAEEARQAQARMDAYAADEAIMSAVRTAREAEEARSMLSLARNYEVAGKPDLARPLYEKLIEAYPGSPSAADAKQRLDALE